MRFYCPEPLSGSPIHPLFLFRFAPKEKIGGLFKEHLPENFFEHVAEYVALPEEADAIILPNNFTFVNDAVSRYIATYAEMGERLHKPVYIFSSADYSDALVFDPRVYVFRYSIYKSNATRMDVCVPTLTEDIGASGITYRDKSGIPTVSFCGKADFASLRERVGAWLKRIRFEVISFSNPQARAHIRGVFWRKWAIEACRHSPLVKTLFIIRKSFSGARQTIELDPTQAREDFIRSISDADFVLAPKGDGNYSNRFLEALAMGRFPVVIDTDCVFPFEDIVDYSKLVVRVPMDQFKHIPTYVRDFYDALSQDEFTARQKLARETFEKHLRQDSFFKEFFKINV